MCIRDRRHPGEHPEERRAERRSQRGRARRHLPEGRQRAQAVSYTHLRAHETVLDLVCRLLLEKKKKKLSTPQKYDLSINKLTQEYVP